jgi:hypothetical protein
MSMAMQNQLGAMVGNNACHLTSIGEAFAPLLFADHR